MIKEGLGVDAIKGVFMKTAGFVVYGQNTCVTYNFRCEEVDRYLKLMCITMTMKITVKEEGG